MTELLRQRLANVRTLKQLWSQGDVSAVVAALREMNDMSTTADFLNATERLIEKGLDAELMLEFSPLIKNLLASRFESHVASALRYLKVMLQMLRQNMSNTNTAPLKDLHPSVHVLTTTSSNVSPLAREISDSLTNILYS